MSVVLLALLAGPAQATEGLAWRWEPGQTRRYHLTANVEVPDAFDVNARVNVDAQVSRFAVGLLVACEAHERAGKAAWVLRCDIERASLSAQPFTYSRGRLLPVLEEWVGVLEKDARVDLIVEHSGKVRSIDLEGVDKSLDRWERIALQMQLVVQRAFAAFDVQLPKGGDDAGAGAWIQRSSWQMMLPSVGGSFGSPEILTSVLAQQGSVVLLGLAGSGTMTAAGETLPGQPRLLVSTSLEGSATFDAAAGELVQAQYVSRGALSSSSTASEWGQAASYNQSVILQRLVEGAPDPTLPPTRETQVAPPPPDPGPLP